MLRLILMALMEETNESHRVQMLRIICDIANIYGCNNISLSLQKTYLGSHWSAFLTYPDGARQWLGWWHSNAKSYATISKS